MVVKKIYSILHTRQPGIPSFSAFRARNLRPNLRPAFDAFHITVPYEVRWAGTKQLCPTSMLLQGTC
jgi:hypothetical protein